MTNFVVTCLISMVWIFGMPGGSRHQEQAARFLVFLLGIATLAAWQKWRERKGNYLHQVPATREASRTLCMERIAYEAWASEWKKVAAGAAPLDSWNNLSEEAKRCWTSAMKAGIEHSELVDTIMVEVSQIRKSILDCFGTSLPPHLLQFIDSRMNTIHERIKNQQ